MRKLQSFKAPLTFFVSLGIIFIFLGQLYGASKESSDIFAETLKGGAPLHAGPEGQIKRGGLLLGTDAQVTYGLLVKNGKVGIGTLTPLEKLTVKGVIQSIQGGFKFPDGTIQTSAAMKTDPLWVQANDNIYRLRGKIGIGKADPSALLDVAGTIRALDILCADCLDASALAVDAITPSELAPTSVEPGTYGSDSHVPQITIDSDGRITSAANVSISSPPTKSSRAGSVMYLKRAQTSVTEEPAKCPINWLEADLEKEVVGNAYKNMVRTCYRTDEACQVMYLKREQISIVEDPAKCPNTWEQADLQSENVGHGYKNTVRTCYRCP